MGKNILKTLLVLALFVLLIQSSFINGYSQSNINLTVDRVDDIQYPKIITYVSVSDAQNYQIRGLTIDNFTIIENSSNVPIQAVTPIYQKPLTIALVIDTSRSMGYGETPSQNKIKQTAAEFVDTLAIDDLVAIISFSDDVIVNQAPTNDKNLMKSALESLKPLGNASLNDAIVDAVSVLQDQPSRRILILLTDGPDSGLSEYTFDQAMDNASQQNVAVYPIAWGGADQGELKKLADLTHGQIYLISGDQPDITAIQAGFNGISQNFLSFREQYELGFISNLPADDAEHEFIVRVNYLGEETEQIAHLTARSGEVQVTLPNYQEGQAVSGNVYFSPQISAPAATARLDITVDNQLMTSINNEPFEYTWNSTTVQPGIHKIAFAVQDNAGNIGSMDIGLDVQAPVTIKIDNPAEQETISGSTVISAEVSAMAQIIKVEFKTDDSLLGTVSTTPYQIQWDLKGVPAGTHTISAIAYDINGFSSEDSISTIVAIQQKSGLIWLAGIATLVVAAVLIPLGLRSRKRIRQQSLSASLPPDQSPLGGPPGNAPAILREIEGINPNHIWNLSPENVRLGRKRDENDIPLKGLNASRKHAMISFNQGHYVIQSLNTQNPVMVNNEPVQQQVLNNGDVIQAGETILKFELSGEGA